MKIVIFGATGGIGKWALKHALEAGHEVTAFVRNPQKITIQHERLTLLVGSIDNDDDLRRALTGKDAVIWCVGIPLKFKYEKMVSFEGHQHLLPIMEELGVKRLVDWATPSVPFSGDKRSAMTMIPSVMAGLFLRQAKKEMVAVGRLVERSNLDWTLVRFIAPKDTPYTGKVKVSFGDKPLSFSISREDIGAFMVEQLTSTEYIHSMPIIGT